MGYSYLKTIPEHWEIGEIENYLELIIDYRGKTPKKANSGIRTLSARSVKNGRINYAQAYFISEKTFEEWETRGKPKPGDVLLTTEGPLGEVAQLGTQRVALAQRLIGLRGKERELDNTYLKYFLISPVGKNELLSKVSGTTVQGIKQSEFRKIKLIKPPYNEQVAIAGILSKLDAKIELNERMNRTLEAVGEAVFSRWFVDFEFPNQEGKPYKTNGGKIIDSEMGKIPCMWKYERMSELITVTDGTHSSPKKSRSGYYLVTSKHVKEQQIDFSQAYKISETDFIEIKKRSGVTTNDILITMIGTVGNVLLVQEKTIDFAIKNIGLFKSSERPDLFEYVYYSLKSQKSMDYVRTRISGTTQGYLTLESLRNFPIVIPTNDLILGFKKIANPLLEKVWINREQTKTLLKLRDILLPKLMSGKIRVPIIKEKMEPALNA